MSLTYKKECTQTFAKKVLGNSYDIDYLSFDELENTDNFDLVSKDKKTAVEITLVITENEKYVVEYEVNYFKGKKLKKNEDSSFVYDRDGRLRFYADNSENLFNSIKKAIETKNEKAKKRLCANIEKYELCLLVSDGGIFDKLFVEQLISFTDKIVFNKIFVITSCAFFVIDVKSKKVKEYERKIN